jgi:hypothetical protein
VYGALLCQSSLTCTLRNLIAPAPVLQGDRPLVKHPVVQLRSLLAIEHHRFPTTRRVMVCIRVGRDESRTPIRKVR